MLHYQRFLRAESGAVPSPTRRVVRRRRDDEDDEPENDGRGNSGPPPTWDGSGLFEDYQIRAQLWLSTTKSKPRARGPLLLKSLSGPPFEQFKYLAKTLRG